MSFLINSPGEGLTEFKGGSFRDEETDRDPRSGLLARNVVFPPGRVETRPGFTSMHTRVNGYISFFYFAHPNGTPYLLYNAFNPGPNTFDLFVMNLNTGVINTLVTSFGPYYLNCAIHGTRVYIAGSFQSSGSFPYIWGGDPAVPARYAFQRPLYAVTDANVGITVPAPAVDGAMTPGYHYVLAVARTVDGHWTSPSPYSYSSAGPTYIPYGLPIHPDFFPAGSIPLTFTPVTTWPTWVDTVQFLVTTSTNFSEYFVIPRELVLNLGGTSTVVTVTLVESDLEIRAWEPGEKYFDQINQYLDGTPPMRVKAAINWGNRVVWVAAGYGGQDCFFPSDPDEPQSITASRHLKNMTGVRAIKSMAVMNNELVGFSDDWVESWADNGDYPVTFSNPEEISTSMGVADWRCVQSRKDQPYLLVVNQQGLWKMEGGQFASIPLSWGLEPVWETVAWTYEYLIHLEHDAVRKQIWMTYLNKSGAWKTVMLAYTHGKGLKDLDYTEVTTAAAVMDSISYIGMVKNPVTKIQDLWFAGTHTGGAGGRVMRQKSLESGDTAADLYKDLGDVRIDSVYETSPLPKGFLQEMMDFPGFVIRVKGSGTLSFTAYSLDRLRSFTNAAAAITLSTAPGRSFSRLLNLQSEKCSLQFSNSAAAGSWFSISYLKLFFRRLAGLG